MHFTLSFSDHRIAIFHSHDVILKAERSEAGRIYAFHPSAVEGPLLALLFSI